MKKADIKTSADLFLYKAEADFHAVQALYKSMMSDEIEIEPEIILFHCQQCIEKCFKAILSHFEIRFRHTHDLQSLLDLCSEHSISIPIEFYRITLLTGFAVEGRYSIIHDDLVQCEEFIPLTARFVQFTERIIEF